MPVAAFIAAERVQHGIPSLGCRRPGSTNGCAANIAVAANDAAAALGITCALAGGGLAFTGFPLPTWAWARPPSVASVRGG
jgi:hypothetical protein